jgi:EAL domain-containing protein (putative c-di-GMP-specific phosphodiesterase class I)
MVDGAIPNAIPDAATHPVVMDLPSRTAASIGSYIGVPLRLSDGQLYGSFCALGHRADPDLDQRDVRFMEMLSDLLVRHLDIEAGEQQERDRITGLIEHGEITVAAQPIVSVHDGQCLGMEALARFPGDQPPDAVFAAAHRAGQGLALERLAVRSAVTALLPLLLPNQYLGVNMSPSAALAVAPLVDPNTPVLHRLVLEITEHAEVPSYSELSTALQPLRDRGLRLAIDDAGAGYASMHHIIELKPDIIKIDRSLVHGVARDQARRRVITSFVLLGLDMEATIVAEGVEESDDLEAIRDLGVDAAQGYLIARPTVNLDEIAQWTRTVGSRTYSSTPSGRARSVLAMGHPG